MDNGKRDQFKHEINTRLEIIKDGVGTNKRKIIGEISKIKN